MTQPERGGYRRIVTGAMDEYPRFEWRIRDLWPEYDWASEWAEWGE